MDAGTYSVDTGAEGRHAAALGLEKKPRDVEPRGDGIVRLLERAEEAELVGSGPGREVHHMSGHAALPSRAPAAVYARKLML